MESINYYQKCVLRLLVDLASVVVVVGILTGIASDKEVTDRTRRDIMNYKQKEDEEPPKDEALAALYKTWNRDFPSPDHLHGANMDAYDREYKFLKELKARNLFHTSVLTDETKLNVYGTAVRLTWGGDVSALHFFFSVTDAERVKRHQVTETVQLTDNGIGEVYGTEHILQTMQYLCDQFIDEYHWFILVKDSTYVNVPSLVKVLERLTPSTEIAISMDNIRRGMCSLEGGLIFSQRLLSSICPRLWECDSVRETTDTDLDITTCISYIAQTSCTSSKQISEEFHTNITSLQLNTAVSMSQLSEEISFLYPVSPVDLIYDIHIHYTEQELQRTEEEIHRLEQEVKSSQNLLFSGTIPRRKYKSGDFNEVAIFDSVHKFINSTNQFYQYIDDTGKVYLDTCKLEKEDLTKDGKVFDTILQMAEDAVGPDAASMENFAYRMVKPNVGVEYQFYFIEERKGKSKRSQDDKVYQVTILQPYGELEIATKEIHPFVTINIVLPVKDGDDINIILDQLSTICGTNEDVSFDCNLTGLFQNKKKNKLSTIRLSDLENMMRKVGGFKVQLITTDHDISSLRNWFHLVDKHLIKDSLILFTNPHLILTKAFLQRCTLNSFKGNKAYFPVHFQLLPGISLSDIIFHPEKYDISNKNGYWANAQYESFCAYKSDLKEIDILPSKIEELIDDLMVKNLDVIRTADPSLLKIWNHNLCSTGKGFRNEDCQKDHRYLNLL